MSRIRHGLPVFVIAALAGNGLGASVFATEPRTSSAADHTTVPDLVTPTEIEKWDWSALGAAWTPQQSAPTLKTPKQVTPSADFSSSRHNDDGSMALTVGRKLPTEWKSKIGIDLSLAPPPTPYQPDQLLRQPATTSTGSAWAKVTVPGVPFGWEKASFDARIVPLNEEGKFAAKLSRSVPVGNRFTVTVQNGYAFSQPLTAAVPAPWATPGTTPTANWSTDNRIRFNILPSGTSLAAAASLSSTDDKWVPSLSAEQKLFGGPLSITGTASETATGTIDKSITAGFKHRW